MGGIIIAYAEKRTLSTLASINKRFVESVWPAEYKNQKDYRGFQNSLYFPPMRRFQRYPKFADRKILRFTGFFNLLKSSAQSSEYLFKKLKIVILVFFIDNAVLQLITTKGPKPTYQITADSRLRNLQFQYQYLSFIDRMTGELK